MADGVENSPEHVNEMTKGKSDLLFDHSCMLNVLNKIPDYSMILTIDGIVLFINDNMKDSFVSGETSIVSGKRPGEILHCANIEDGSAECGATSSCEFCGILNTILSSNQLERSIENEASLISIKNGKEEQLDLVVSSSQITLMEEELIIVHFRDITIEKRRKAMERVFFHDVMNTAHGLKGCMEIMESMVENERATEILERSQVLTESLIEEITFQKDVASAETGELELVPVQANSMELLQEVIQLLSNHSCAKGKNMRVDGNASNFTLVVDRKILRRVLVNMVKNGLEASTPGNDVILNCQKMEGNFIFTVWNMGAITEEVNARIWQRSFSTKGEGRGIGTYSMKLFTEKYLGGSIDFISDEDDGTTFTMTLD